MIKIGDSLLFLSKKKRNAYINIADTLTKLNMNKWGYDKLFNITLGELLFYIWKGDWHFNLIFAKHTLFSMYHTYYDGHHVQINLLFISFYSRY